MNMLQLESRISFYAIVIIQSQSTASVKENEFQEILGPNTAAILLV